MLTFRHVGVECITQAIAYQVKAERRQEDEQAWNEHKPGSAKEVIMTIANQIAPACCGWRNAKVEVAQNRFQDDICTDYDRGTHNDWPATIGQHVPEHQP